MKRILFSIIFSVAGFFAFAEPEFVRINVSDANIRQEPTASSARLVWNGDMLDWSTLKTKQAYHERKGTVVQVLERTQGWTKIYFNFQTGWVSNTLIEEVTPAKITKMRFEEVVEQNSGADYKSFVWLDDDHVLFTQHGGEGTQEILFGKFSKGTLLLYGNPLKVYTNLSSGFGIEKMGVDYTKALYQVLEPMMMQEGLQNVFYEKAFERLIAQGHTYQVLNVSDLFSCELDTVEDFETAKEKIPASLF